MLQQPALALDAAAIAGQRAAAADEAVAGDDEADGVEGIGEADGAGRVRPVEQRRDLAVAAGLARRYRAQRFPALLLKSRPAAVDRDRIERGEVAVEIGPDGVGRRKMVDSREFHIRSEPRPGHRHQAMTGIAEFQRDERPPIGDHMDRTDRVVRLDGLEQQAQDRS